MNIKDISFLIWLVTILFVFFEWLAQKIKSFKMYRKLKKSMESRGLSDEEINLLIELQKEWKNER